MAPAAVSEEAAPEAVPVRKDRKGPEVLAVLGAMGPEVQVDRAVHGLNVKKPNNP